MEIFLTNSYRGASLLSSYRNQPPLTARCKKTVAGVEDTTGVPTRADFTKTVQGVASPFFLVSPDAPSDRERLVYVNSIFDSILNYRDVVFSAEAPVWCPFNSPALHRHIMKERLERAGLVNSSRFVCNPVEGAGEMTAFKYTSTTPQHLVFPVGSDKINWLTVLRGSSRMGKAFARSSKLANGPISKEDGRLGALELKRFRIWRAFDWIGECCRRGGMIRYEPFSVGTALYDAEAERLNPKSVYERSILYLGDHFARETVLLSDVCQGGRYNSDLWAIADAVYRYGQKCERSKKKDSTHKKYSEEDWVTALEDISDLNDNGPRHDSGRLEDAILEYDVVGAEKRRRMLDFAHSVLSNAQRDSVYDAFSHLNEGTAAAFVDACVVSPARSGVYLMLYSLLKIINFDILNIVGYEAHRILVFKLFVPALLGIFLSNGGLGDVFENGSFMLELFSKKAGKETIRSVLERSSMAASETRRSKNYAKNDTATLYGELTESTAKLPLAINLAAHTRANERSRELLNTFNEGIIKVSIAKEMLSKKQRHARRVLKRRRKVNGEHEEGCSSSSKEEEEEEEEEGRVSCFEEESSSSSDGEAGGGDKKENLTKKRSNRRHLVAGRLQKNRRLLPPGLCLSTITNGKRQVNVEDIQKMLSARQTKEKNLQQILDDCKNGKAAKKSIDDNAVRCYLLALMNIFDSVFGLERGSLMNSIHTNASDASLTKAENDSILAENNEAKVGVIKPSASDSDAKQRLAELIMDPPSLVGITDHTVVERTLQNEQMLRSLMSNPVFTSILSAEHGDVGRYVVLSNIVKFMSVALSCLIDGDMPLLEDTRKNVKTALDRGKVKHVKKSGNAFGKSSNSRLDSYDYRDAGSYPSGASELREQLLPPCIKQLRSIAILSGRRGRVSMSKQTCEHAFCRMLKFLYYSLDPSAPGKDSRYANFFVDSASVATLYQTVEADKKDLYNNLVRRVMAGSDSWLTDRDYTSIDREDDALSPVDFFSVLKMAIIDEGIVMSPKPGSGDSRKVPGTGYEIYEESMAIKCEAFRARMLKRSELLPDAPFVHRTPEELEASLKRKDYHELLISMEKKTIIKEESETREEETATVSSLLHPSKLFRPLRRLSNTWSSVAPYTERLARLAIRYVRAFTDTWAFLVNESLADDDILAPSQAFIRWKKALRANNPLLTLSNAVNRDERGKNHISVDFELNVDEAKGEYHAAVLLIAIDSFLSLLSASNAVQAGCKRIKTKTNIKDGFFSLYVPAKEPLEYLLSNKLGQRGFPVGDSGPFRKWSSINAVKISASESNADVINRLETVDRETVSAAIRATKKTNKYLDDSEMSRCLMFNKKKGKGEMYTFSSDRGANNIRSLEMGGAIAEAAIALKKRSRRRRDMSPNPIVFVERLVSPKKRKLTAAAMCGGVSNGGGSSKKRRTTISTASSSSAASAEIEQNKFTSLLMSPQEFNIAFNSSFSLRGAQRTKSLVNKYTSLVKANFTKAPKNNPEGVLSRWCSPKGRNIVVVDDSTEGSSHGMETIGFSVTCKKSELFKSISSLHTLLRQWMKVSSGIYSKITHVSENVPKMETVAEVLKTALKKTSRTMVRGVRPILSFRVPPCFSCEARDKKWSEKMGSFNSPSPTSVMGMSNERYAKIVEVFDFFMSRGVFVNAALNLMFFDNCVDECPPNIDVMVTASECMGHVTELNNFKADLGSAVVSAPPPQQSSPLLNDETPRQFLERKMAGPVDTFVNTSQNFRSHKRLSHDLTNTYRDSIANILSNRGAIAAFNDMTIKKRFSSSEVVMPLESKTESDLQKPDSLFDKTDAFKSGLRREPGLALSSSYQTQSYTPMPSCTGAMASAIVIADMLTVPTLAKITSSKRFPDNIVFR